MVWSLADGGRAHAACAAPSDATSYRKNADLIALGTVEDVGVFPWSSRVEVSVERVFKGESGRTLYVTTDSGSKRATSVDVRFGEGERYLLYLREEDGELRTSICDGTRELPGDSAQIPSGLGEGAPPEEAAGPGAGDRAMLPRTAGATLLIIPSALASVVVGTLLWRRRR